MILTTPRTSHGDHPTDRPKRRLLPWILILAFITGWTPPDLIADEPTVQPLTRASQILGLSPEEADSEVPVQIEGVVTAVPDWWPGGFFLQDASTGIFVNDLGGNPPEVGDRLQVRGFTNSGGYAPMIDKPEWQKTGTSPLPESKPVTIDELMSGSADSQRIKISGVVRAYHVVDGQLFLIASSGRHRFEIVTSPTSIEDPSQLIGKQVTAQGTATTWFHKELRRPLGISVILPQDSDLTFGTESPGNPFDGSITPLDQISQYLHDYEAGKRVHVRGTVVYQRPGQDLFIQSGDRGLQVRTSQRDLLKPGDTVDAVGFVDLEGFLPVLNDAVYRKRETPGTPPQAVRVDSSSLIEGLHHAEFISLKGVLLDLSLPAGKSQTEDPGNETFSLTIQTPDFVFTAEGPANGAGASLDALPVGSIVEVSGICLLEIKSSEWSGAGTMDSLQLLLPSAGNIRIIEKAPWLNPERLRVILIFSSLVLAIAIGWILTVSRKNRALKGLIRERFVAQKALQHAHDELDDRVKERTAQLKVEMLGRKESEVRFKATLAERTRLAQELHDTLEQSLTGIGLQMDAAVETIHHTSKIANPPLEMARNLMARSQLELRRSIWDLRSRELEEFDLPSALKVSAEEILETTPTKLTCTILGEPFQLSEIVEENLLRIGREALTNLTKHAHADHASLTLDYQADQVVLEVVDDGKGFDPARCLGSKEGHFGLTGMTERAKRIRGTLNVTTGPGKGTRIRLQLSSASARENPADRDS